MSSKTLWNDGVCTVCGGERFLDFVEIKGIPAQDGVIWNTREEALAAPRGDVSLSLCLDCSFVGNRTFEPELLKFTGYNVSSEYSPLFRDFIETLATGLIERHDIRDKTVIDLGCGNGYFLKTICKLGGNRGMGFDPSYTDTGGDDSLENIKFVQDYYSEKYTDHGGDLITCRQVIDHLASPKAFLEMVRRAIGDRDGTVVYFEVPNPDRRLLEFVPWKAGYEHGSFFFPESFRLLFELCGFEVKAVTPVHSGDYLGIEAAATRDLTLVPVSEAVIRPLAEALEPLSSQFDTVVSGWKERLAQMEKDGVKAIPWGAGEHGIGFLNVLDIQEQMPYIVDINTYRQGKYVPGTGQQVVAPEFLVEYKPDLVIITLPVYETEIKEQVKQLGVSCDFLVL